MAMSLRHCEASGPNGTLTPTDRARYIERILQATMYSAMLDPTDSNETALSDLLADLMHYADSMGLDFGELYRRANRHHVGEAATFGVARRSNP